MIPKPIILGANVDDLLDAMTQVRICQADVERLCGLGDPFHAAVADQVAGYPSFVERVAHRRPDFAVRE